MPEQISKYPEITLKVLEGAGAVCGKGVDQTILTQCPAEQFCALPTGEICVYGINQIPQMTQIETEELAQVVCPDKTPLAKEANGYGPELMGPSIIFIAGILANRVWKRAKVKN